MEFLFLWHGNRRIKSTPYSTCDFCLETNASIDGFLVSANPAMLVPWQKCRISRQEEALIRCAPFARLSMHRTRMCLTRRTLLNDTTEDLRCKFFSHKWKHQTRNRLPRHTFHDDVADRQACESFGLLVWGGDEWCDAFDQQLCKEWVCESLREELMRVCLMTTVDTPIDIMILRSSSTKNRYTVIRCFGPAALIWTISMQCLWASLGLAPVWYILPLPSRSIAMFPTARQALRTTRMSLLQERSQSTSSAPRWRRIATHPACSRESVAERQCAWSASTYAQALWGKRSKL